MGGELSSAMCFCAALSPGCCLQPSSMPAQGGRHTGGDARSSGHVITASAAMCAKTVTAVIPWYSVAILASLLVALLTKTEPA
jgi:hypothetical protein